ncbi:class I SAM-dependent methyltransferase [Streptomyces sp. NPDC052012]|uniref:class I SAM-dependent methyltransferase n=1 Tax=Streptomyces sp. NPDC052012 TaxID=3155051 RepID=UPI00344E1542
MASETCRDAAIRELMAELSRLAAASHGHVLEVGFGMGISASMLQDEGIASHTIVEANPEVARAARAWADGRRTRTRVVEGRWQDVIDSLGTFDGILFDTYPADEREYEQYVVRDAAYIEHFLPAAAEHLEAGGTLSYYTMEIDSLSRRHQRALLRHFSSFRVGVVSGLQPPADCTYWWADSMAAVAAIR